MKKVLIAFFLLTISLLWVLPVNATQNANISITPSETTLYPESTVTFTVKITNCNAAKSIGIIPSYDNDIFELVSGEWIISDFAISDFSDGTAVIAYASPRAFDENVFKFTLKAKSEVPLKSYKVTTIISIKNGNETVPCSVMDTSVTISCKHSYSSFLSINDTQHQRTCSKCKAVETQDHSYTNACDTECNDCEYTRSTSHSYNDTWTSDQASHWYECSVCKTKKDESAHIPGADATETSPQKCTICQYVIIEAIGHTHTYEESWKNDGNGHWKTCASCGGKSTIKVHTYDTNCDTDCNDCGYARAISHTYGNNYLFNEESHWHICNICQAFSETVKHNYDNNCDVECNDCGHQRATEHSFDNGTITIIPTEDSLGEKVYTCTNCGTTKIVKLEYDVYISEDTSVSHSSGDDNPNSKGNNKFSPVVLTIVISIICIIGVSSFLSIKYVYYKRKRT